jgi:hypothetical protein
MWGWKVVEKKVERKVNWEQINQVMEEAGFTKRIANLEHAIFQKTGAQFPLIGEIKEKVDIEVAIAKTEAGLFLQARYDTFALFDTGDLEKFVDGLVTQLKST